MQPRDDDVLDVLPDTAAIQGGELTIGGALASSLVGEFGTPLVVYCEQTLREAARAYRRAAGDALVVYGSKAFPNVALLRLFAEEGLGADVSTLGELAFALRAGVPANRIVVHGNNKSDEELVAAAEAGVAFVVLDAVEEVDRAARAGVKTVLARVTPGIDAETHDAIKTAHHGSKFGLTPGQAIEALSRSQDAGLDVVGLHVHVGSQLLDTGPFRMAVDWLAAFSAECRSELGWVPKVLNLGGGLGIPYVPDERAPEIEAFVAALVGRVERSWSLHDLPRPQLILEPGRTLVGRAGVTLYEVGVVKEASETTTYVALDGGMSDNPRPQLYGARYTALIANRGDGDSGVYTVCGKHCESGDIVIERVPLNEPRRGDVLAVPATGAYTLAMASNYNAVPLPAAVLVANGDAQLIRRRQTVDDLLALEA